MNEDEIEVLKPAHMQVLRAGIRDSYGELFKNDLFVNTCLLILAELV